MQMCPQEICFWKQNMSFGYVLEMFSCTQLKNVFHCLDLWEEKET